jgi:hypothetical protein
MLVAEQAPPQRDDLAGERLGRRIALLLLQDVAQVVQAGRN